MTKPVITSKRNANYGLKAAAYNEWAAAKKAEEARIHNLNLAFAASLTKSAKEG